MDAIKFVAGSLKYRGSTDTVNLAKHIENKDFRQALRFELNWVLDNLKGVEDERDRKATFKQLIQFSLHKCEENALATGKIHKKKLDLSEKQQKAFPLSFPRLVTAQLTFNEQYKAEPDNQNIKVPLEGKFDDKHYWFVEKGMNDNEGWSVLTGTRKDGKSKTEKSVPPMRLTELNKPDKETPIFFPGSFDRAPPNLNVGNEGKQYKRITATASWPAKAEAEAVPEPGDVIKNLLSAKDGELYQVINSELESAIKIYGQNKEVDVEQLITVHMICSNLIHGDEKQVFESLFPPLVKARIEAGKRFQENPFDPGIQVPLEGHVGLFVEKKYGDQFFLSREKWEGNKADVTCVREKLMELGMPDQYELPAPPSGSLPAIPDVAQAQTFPIPQIKKETPDLSLPPSRSVPPAPLRTPNFPQLSNPTLPVRQLTPTPGSAGPRLLPDPVKPQISNGLRQSNAGMTLNTMGLQVPKSHLENTGEITPDKKMERALSATVEDKPK